MVTGRYVGRVLAVREEGDQLALTLGPVEITEIVREGSFELDQPLDLDDTLLFKAPESAPDHGPEDLGAGSGGL